MIDSLKYLRSPTLKGKDIGIRKSEFVTKTQFLYSRKRRAFLNKYIGGSVSELTHLQFHTAFKQVHISLLSAL